MSGDPEDWPLANGGALCRELDSTQRCPICGELFETPLSLRCGHAFCASCIRSSIQYQEKSGEAGCPQCRARCEAGDLRPCPQLRAICAAYVAARPVLLSSMQAAAVPQVAVNGRQKLTAAGARHRKRASGDIMVTPAAACGTRTRSGSGRATRSSAAAAGAGDSPDQGIVLSLSSGSDNDGAGEPPAKRTRSQSAAVAGRNMGGGSGSAEGKTEAEQRVARSGVGARSGSRPATESLSTGTDVSLGRLQGADGNVPGGSGGRQSTTAGGDSELDDAAEAGGVSDGADDPDFVASQPGSRSSSEEPPSPSPPPPPSRPRLGGGKERLPRGHVRCPSCSVMLPESFINTHLDGCLARGGALGSGLSTGNTGRHTAAELASSGGRSDGAQRAANGADSGRPAGGHGGPNGSGSAAFGGGANGGSGGGALKVPPKLAFTLLSDKQLRETCKRYGLPPTGKKEVMAERYQRLRLEVQTGNDSGQRGRTYADLARRVVKAENKAANAAFAPLARVPAGSGAGISAAGGGDGFDDLIRATRERAAAHKAALAAAARAEPTTAQLAQVQPAEVAAATERPSVTPGNTMASAQVPEIGNLAATSGNTGLGGDSPGYMALNDSGAALRNPAAERLPGTDIQHTERLFETAECGAAELSAHGGASMYCTQGREPLRTGCNSDDSLYCPMSPSV